MYVYSSHLGHYFTSDIELDEGTLFCEACDDTDVFVGEFDSAIEFLKERADTIDINEGHGIISLKEIMPVLSVFPDCPNLNQAKKVVRENQYDYKANSVKKGLN